MVECEGSKLGAGSCHMLASGDKITCSVENHSIALTKVTLRQVLDGMINHGIN